MNKNSTETELKVNTYKLSKKPKLTIEQKKKAQRKKDKLFIARMLIMTFALSIVFSVVTEIVLNGGNIIISMILLLSLIAISVVFDTIGTATASCEITPFISKASRKDHKAVIAMNLLKNAEKVSSFCNDVVGDICGIVSGGCASAIVLAITQGGTSTFVVSVVFSSIISALTVGGKAIGKLLAIRDGEKIIVMVSTVLSVIKRK